MFVVDFTHLGSPCQVLGTKIWLTADTGYGASMMSGHNMDVCHSGLAVHGQQDGHGGFGTWQCVCAQVSYWLGNERVKYVVDFTYLGSACQVQGPSFGYLQLQTLAMAPA
jgi:hypothetical protein